MAMTTLPTIHSPLFTTNSLHASHSSIDSLIKEKTCPITVAVRIKPPTVIKSNLNVNQSKPCVFCNPDDPHTLYLNSENTHLYQSQPLIRSFAFDHIFNSFISQESLYQQCAYPILSSVVEGFNATILAYGQTGSGKTYTMGLCNNPSMLPDTLGMTPRFIQDLYHLLENKSYQVKVSFVELYKEQVRDLLTHSSNTTNGSDLIIRENKNGNITIKGITVVMCADVKAALQQLEKGALARTVGGTQMNHASSRSHAIFTLVLEQTVQTKEGTKVKKISKLNLVDLAGSERQKRTCAEGLRFKESIKINSGLLALGNVINALSQKEMHVPYRDSKLTRLLQDSLAGNSITLFIACICPLEQSKQETLNTLMYASRAKHIENRPTMNWVTPSSFVSSMTTASCTSSSATSSFSCEPTLASTSNLTSLYPSLVLELKHYLTNPNTDSKGKLLHLVAQLSSSPMKLNQSSTTLLDPDENSTPVPKIDPCAVDKSCTPTFVESVDSLDSTSQSSEYSLLVMLQLQHQRDQLRIRELEAKVDELTQSLADQKQKGSTFPKKSRQELEYYRKTIHELKKKLRDLLAMKGST